MQDVIITIDWVWIFGIFGVLLTFAWAASGKFTRIETLLETMDKRLRGIEERTFSPAKEK